MDRVDCSHSCCLGCRRRMIVERPCQVHRLIYLCVLRQSMLTRHWRVPVVRRSGLLLQVVLLPERQFHRCSWFPDVRASVGLRCDHPMCLSSASVQLRTRCYLHRRAGPACGHRKGWWTSCGSLHRLRPPLPILGSHCWSLPPFHARSRTRRWAALGRCSG